MAIQGFDKDFYLNAKLAQLQADSATANDYDTVADVEDAFAAAGLTAEQHYAEYGHEEGLAPNAFFDPAEYVQAKAEQMVDNGEANDVNAAKDEFISLWNQVGSGNVYDHYLQYGEDEDVNPSNAFDVSAYYDAKLAQLQADPTTADDYETVADVKAAFDDAGLSALGHFIAYGQDEDLEAPAVSDDDQVDVDDDVDPGVPGETFSLTEALNNLSDAENARAEFLDGNQENEALGFGEDEEHSNAQVVTAIEDASDSAQDNVEQKENDVQDAEFDLSAARKADASAPEEGVGLGDAIEALDTLKDDTRLRDQTIEDAATEAQTQVDESETLYISDGDEGLVSLDELDKTDGVTVTAEAESVVGDTAGEYPDVDLTVGGETLTVNTRDLLVNLVESDAVTVYDRGTKDDSGDIVLDGDTEVVTADQVAAALASPKESSNISIAHMGDDFPGGNFPGGAYWIDLGGREPGNTDGGSRTALFTREENNDALFHYNNETGEITVQNEQTSGTSNPLTDLLTQNKGNNTLDNLGDVLKELGLGDQGKTASELQDNVNDAKDAVDSFVSANGDNEALLDGVRDAINAHVGNGGKDVDGVQDNDSLLDVRDNIADLLDVKDGEEVDTDAVNALVEAIGAESVETVFGGDEKDLTDEQIAVNNAFDKAGERVELDGKVNAEETIFHATDEGGVLKSLTDLQDARQDLKDEITKAEDALTQAEDDATEIDGLVSQLESLDGDIEEAQNTLTDSEEDGGYGVNLVEFDQNNKASASDDNDVILFSGAEDRAEINGFGAQGQDQLYFGEKYSDAAFVELGEDEDINGSVGDAGKLEIFWEVDSSDNLTLHVEDETFGGSATGQQDLTQITLNGVGDDVDTENGFLTAGTAADIA